MINGMGTRDIFLNLKHCLVDISFVSVTLGFYESWLAVLYTSSVTEENG